MIQAMSCSSDRLTSKLAAVRAGVFGWSAQCPCHSEPVVLIIRVGVGGRTNLRCEEGCTPDAVISKLGLEDPGREYGELPDTEDIGPTPRSLAEVMTDPTVDANLTAVLPRLAWAGRVTLLAARKRSASRLLRALALLPSLEAMNFLGSGARQETPSGSRSKSIRVTTRLVLSDSAPILRAYF
jgi:hypothetical protein